MASSADDGHGGGELNMLKLEESLSNSNFGFSDSVDRLGEQSPMAQSSPLTRSFSMSTDGREALNNYGVVLGLLEEHKREKDCQIVELKREKEELKKKDFRDKQTEMNVRIERLQSEKQVIFPSYYNLSNNFYNISIPTASPKASLHAVI